MLPKCELCRRAVYRDDLCKFHFEHIHVNPVALPPIHPTEAKTPTKRTVKRRGLHKSDTDNQYSMTYGSGNA